MHELSISRGILSTVLEYHQQHHKISPIKSIQLTIGSLTQIDIPSLRFNFSVIARHTVAESAILNINHIEAKAECGGCESVFTLQQYYDLCPNCQHQHKTILQGEEMNINSMEIL